MFSKEQIGGIVRTIAAAAFGYLAGKGIVDGGSVEALSGAVSLLAVTIWSVVSKKPTA